MAMAMQAAAIAAGSCCSGVLLLLLGKRSVRFIGKDEQLRVQQLTGNVVHNGPGLKLLNPLTYSAADVVKGETLGNMDYLKVKETFSGKQRIEVGPQLFFLGAYDVIQQRGIGVTLGQTEYLIVTDRLTGVTTMVKGPTVWFPSATEEAGRTQQAVSLQANQYLRIKDTATGQRWIQKGKALVFMESTWATEGPIRSAWTLKSFEYVRLLDKVTGQVTVFRGEQTVFPSADQELLDSNVLQAIDLKVDEYVRIEDMSSGQVRVTAGPQMVFLGPHERELDNGKQNAVQVDEEHAVLVRSLSTGQLRLATEKQLFVPKHDEVIQEVRKLVTLADNEAMIIKDKDGNYHYHYGNPAKESKSAPRSFFLQPYAEVVPLWWSSGMRRQRRDLRIERFDCRAQYMWFEFECRTSDNVELVLECTFFWEVMDLATMIAGTGNLPGDIYNQARSQFVKHVARVTLKSFMQDLHSISKTIFDADLSFYERRGVKIHSLEVTRYHCKEARTSEVLQQVIEETTNRLNRLSQAESENEVKIFRMHGQIEQEKLNSELLEIQHSHTKDEAAVSGAAEAKRVAAFMDALQETVPELKDRLHVWETLRKTDALSVVSSGGATMYYTPNDVNLSIETKKGEE